MARIRVLVADGHRIFAEALATALAAEPDVDVAAAGSAHTAERALDRAVAEHRPFQVLLVDADLAPGPPGPAHPGPPGHPGVTPSGVTPLGGPPPAQPSAASPASGTAVPRRVLPPPQRAPLVLPAQRQPAARPPQFPPPPAGRIPAPRTPAGPPPGATPPGASTPSGSTPDPSASAPGPHPALGRSAPGDPARAGDGPAGGAPADGIALVARARAAHPGLQVVVLAVDDDPRRVVQALTAGASAWVAKESSLGRLMAVVRGVLRDETHVPPLLLTGVIRELTAARRDRTESERLVESLTPRERQVLRCMVAGLGRQAVADRLFLSPHTVRTHMQNVLGKLGVHSTLAAVAVARRAGVGPAE